MLRTGSITQKLTTLILLISGTVVLLTCGTLLTYEVVTFRRAMVRTLTTLAQVVAANSTAALAFDNRADATNVLSALVAEPHIVAAALYDRDGNLFARFPGDMGDGGVPGSPGTIGSRFAAGDLSLYQPVLTGTHQLGTLYLRSDLAAMYERFTLYGGVVVAVIIFSGLVAVLLSARLQRHVSRPVLALAETAQIVTRERDYSVRARRFSDDELGQLTDAFNSMLERVQDQDLSLRQGRDRLQHEVDERARAEEEVRTLNADLERRVAQRTEALAAANKELESFSYSVSHDLRAPLRHVLGYVELLHQDLKGQLSERAQRYVETIRRASTEMGQLIDDLLAFSRTNRSEMREVVVPLDPLVHATINTLEAATQGRNIAWQIESLPDVIGDPVLLRQVFANLIDNAVKYSRMRDPACIAIGSVAPEDGLAVLFVRDNGAGFDMTYAQKLFGVFQRLHRAEDFEGTGIGLATAQRIVARHGGRIWAESAVDQGATFYLTLRRAASA
ncbi:MAG: ATP-binding protein [Vicinamibacterales bacterium]